MGFLKRNYNFLAFIILFLLAIAVYSNTLHLPFYFDDEGSITKNEAIKDISDIKNIWGFWPTRCITYFTIALNYHFGKLNVIGYHLFNLFTHLAAAVLAWRLSILTLGAPKLKDEGITKHPRLIAFFVGAIFVVHPVQTEAVTYIIQRAASLAAFFYLASLTFYAKSRLLRSKGDSTNIPLFYYALSLISAVMAMFTKEMAITLPLMILVYEVSFFNNDKVTGRKKFLPILLTLLVIPLTMAATQMVDVSQMRRVSEPPVGISPWNYILTQFRVIITYIRLCFIPIKQNLDYDYRISQTILEPAALGSLLLLAGILFAAYKLSRRYRIVSFSIFWFFITLLPESSIIPIRDVISEHRLYLPMFGYSLFLVSLAYYLLNKKSTWMAIVILALVINWYAVLTRNRNFDWQDELTLWNDVVSKSPGKARPYNNRGKAYLSKGDCDRAISDFTEAIILGHGYYEVYYNRGTAYAKKGDYDKALDDFDKVIRIKPDYIEAYVNRANVYVSKGDFIKASSDFDRALTLNPNLAIIYYNKAVAYFMEKRYDKSWECVHKAEELKKEISPGFLNELKNASGRER